MATLAEAGTAVEPAPHCANCGTARPGRYCPHCGQSAAIGVPTVGKFLHELVEKSLGVEGQVALTLRTLVFRPGRLTVDYLAGRRQRYMSPMRLYLAVSVLFFLLLSLVPGLRVDIGRGGIDVLTEVMPESRIEAHTGVAFIDDRVARFAALPMEQQHRALRDRLVHNAPKGMLLMVPWFATLLAILYRGRRYGEHLLTALHFHSFAFLLLPIGLIPWPMPAHDWINELANLGIAVYLLVMLRTVYGGGWIATLLRLLVIAGAYAAALVAAILGGVMLTLAG